FLPPGNGWVVPHQRISTRGRPRADSVVCLHVPFSASAEVGGRTAAGPDLPPRSLYEPTSAWFRREEGAADEAATRNVRAHRGRRHVAAEGCRSAPIPRVASASGSRRGSAERTSPSACPAPQPAERRRRPCTR